jgi:hypothetical protein
MEWLNERVPYLENGNWIYNLICFCLGKRKEKMTYKELYMLFSRLYENTLGVEKSKQTALIKVLDIYKHLHNGQLPEVVE